MNDRRDLHRQIARFVLAAVSFAVIVTMLIANLLNVARAAAATEKADLSVQILKH
jgi:hypothetical protein